MEWTEVKTEIEKKENLLAKPLRVDSFKQVDTDSGVANIVTATLLETKKSVNFFMSTDRSGEGYVGKTYILKTATSAKNRQYYFLQEIAVKV